MNLPSRDETDNFSLVLDEAGALELRAQLVRRSDSGDPTHVDLRLYRCVGSDLGAGAFSMTGAGFRVPLRLVPDLVGRLLALAKAAGR